MVELHGGGHTRHGLRGEGHREANGRTEAGRQEYLEKITRMAKYILKSEFIGAAEVSRSVAWPVEVMVHSDSDLAGCRENRQSTIGGVVRIACGTLKHLSCTQQAVALSSAGADLNSLSRFPAESLRVQSLVADFVVERQAVLHIDASAQSGSRGCTRPESSRTWRCKSWGSCTWCRTAERSATRLAGTGFRRTCSAVGRAQIKAW